MALMQGSGNGAGPGRELRAQGIVKEGPAYMLRLAALVVVGVLVQTTVAPHLTVLGAKPDTTLVMVMCVALLRGPMWGSVVGFATGLLLDIALMQTMGISSLLFTLAGYFGGRYGEGLDTDSWVPPLFTVFLATLVVQFLNAVIMFLLGIEASVSFVLIRIVLPSAVLAALLASPFFMVTRWWLGGDRRDSLFVGE
jgi:rod shape-determining protein MreD